MTSTENPTLTQGAEAYETFWRERFEDPEFRQVYEREAAKKQLWLALVEARQEANLTQAQLAARLGVSQAQVARIEKRGYDAYTLKTLRKYMAALGEGYGVEVRIRTPASESTVSA